MSVLRRCGSRQGSFQPFIERQRRYLVWHWLTVGRAVKVCPFHRHRLIVKLLISSGVIDDRF